MLLVDLLGDALLEGALVDLVGDLRDDQALAAVLALLHMDLGTHRDDAAAGLVGLADAVGAHDDATGREVRAGQDTHEVVGGGVGVVDHHADGLRDLGQVVGRHVGRHADGDALAAVHEQVGEARGQDRGLLQGLVIVGLEVDGLLFHVAQHLHGGIGQTGLRVTHGCRGVAVDGAEVAVAVDQGQAHGEVLGKADHGVVDGGVAMGVVLAHDLADRPGRLLVRAGRDDVGLVHGVEDAALDGLEAVADVRQGAGHDDRHGVLEEGLLHLGGHVGGLEGTAVDVGEGQARARLVGDGMVEAGAGEVHLRDVARLLIVVLRQVDDVLVLILVELVLAAEVVVLVVGIVVREIDEVVVIVVTIVCHMQAFLLSVRARGRCGRVRCRGSGRPWRGSG